MTFAVKAANAFRSWCTEIRLGWPPGKGWDVRSLELVIVALSQAITAAYRATCC
ncbi:hypothetical protein ACN22W_33955 [Burkholderia theae]|uniref:hypothetical protein n=1 Tax=Burkholderia theae TaxID=3143496 RepID=UPI003AFB817B